MGLGVYGLAESRLELRDEVSIRDEDAQKPKEVSGGTLNHLNVVVSPGIPNLTEFAWHSCIHLSQLFGHTSFTLSECDLAQALAKPGE